MYKIIYDKDKRQYFIASTFEQYEKFVLDFVEHISNKILYVTPFSE